MLATFFSLCTTVFNFILYSYHSAAFSRRMIVWFSFLSRNFWAHPHLYMYIFLKWNPTPQTVLQLAFIFQCTLLIIMLSKISSWGCTVMCLIKSLIDQHLGCFQFFTSKRFFKNHPSSIFSHLHEYICREIFLVVKLQGQRKFTFLILLGI